jgi:hypothetical protein
MVEPSWTTSLTVVLLVFAVATLLLHALLVVPDRLGLKLRPLGELGWKAADYGWLVLSGVSLVISVSQARVLQADAAAAEGLRAYAAAKREVLEGFERSQSLLCETPPAPGPLTSADLAWMAEQQRLGCAWFRAASEGVHDAFLTQTMPALPLDQLPDRTALQAPGAGEAEVQRFAERLAALESLAALTRQSLLLGQRSALDRALIMLGPLLFALAFALRLTKVSGEVRLAREKARRPDAD